MTIQPIGSASVALYITPADLKEHGLTPAWFSFDELEPVVAAARDLPAPRPDAALLWWEDRWWLSLGAGEEQAIARLSEFGRCETARPHLEARLAEHGRPVWDQDALTALLSYFPV